jgi:hypothetical protein
LPWPLTGALGSGNGGTRLIKADRDTNRNFAVLYVGNSATESSSSINLAANAIKGTNSVTLVSSPRIGVGEIILIDQVTDNDPRVWWGPQHNPPGGGSRRWFARQDRSLAQMMEVTAVSGNTVTFSTPFHMTFKTECAAQLSRYAIPVLHRVGIEDLYVYGGMGGRALDTCPRGQVVKLSPGTFNINGGGLRFRRSDCTLRGSGRITTVSSREPLRGESVDISSSDRECHPRR